MQNPSSREFLGQPMQATGDRRAKSLATRLCSGWSLAIIAIVVYWLLFFYQICGEWQVNPQYDYGYLVPLLGIVLFWRRWPGRPVPNPGDGKVAIVVAGAFLLIAFPLRVLFEANPEWRLLYWISGLQVLGVSLCALAWAGGTRWARYFAAPLAFMLIALPWPVELEQAAIQGLMRFVAGLTVGVANMLGIPALQHGNIIEVSAGLVGIDEACSGVRSLQSSLMLSLFLGEMNRWSWMRRVALLAASMLFVILANLVRTTFLVYVAANRGIHQMQALHDTAGLLIMLIVLPGLLGLSYLMKPREQRAEPSIAKAFNLRPIPVWVGLVMICWFAAIEITTEMWYRDHEKTLVANVSWAMAWPDSSPHFRKTELPENARIILRCSTSDSASWQDDDGNEWSAFVLSWSPGRNSTQLAKGHRPDICFPAAGAKLIDDFGKVDVAAGGFDMPFRYQSFENGGKLLHVFYCLWSDRISPTDTKTNEGGSRASRIQAALAGERNLGQKVLEIVISGPETRDEAIKLLRSEAPALIRKT